MPAADRPIRLRVVPTGDSHRVTTLELFFDLVFVFAFTQVTALMAHDPTILGLTRGFVLLALLWWAWCSYAWLGNQAQADEGVVRPTMIAAMAAMFIVALTIPEAFDDRAGGVFAPVALALSYVAVRWGHLTCYFVAARDDNGLRRQLMVTAVPVSAAGALLVTGAVLGPPYQSALWALALLVDYSGIWLAGTSGWRLPSPGHFAERHGLIFIVALGESLVALGVGVEQHPVSSAVIGACLLGVLLTAGLWWLYFDVVAHVAELTLAETVGQGRARLARDSYTYLHFPIVMSVIFIALGLKKVLEMVADTSHYAIGDPLSVVPLVALYGGIAVHLLGHVAFRRRNTGTWNPHRTVTAFGILLLVPVAGRLPALGALGMVTAVVSLLVSYEVLRFREARHEVRQHPHQA